MQSIVVRAVRVLELSVRVGARRSVISIFELFAPSPRVSVSSNTYPIGKEFTPRNPVMSSGRRRSLRG